MNCIIVYNKPWSSGLAKKLSLSTGFNFSEINKKKQLTSVALDKIKPELSTIKPMTN